MFYSTLIFLKWNTYWMFLNNGLWLREDTHSGRTTKRGGSKLPRSLRSKTLFFLWFKKKFTKAHETQEKWIKQNCMLHMFNAGQCRLTEKGYENVLLSILKIFRIQIWLSFLYYFFPLFIPFPRDKKIKKRGSNHWGLGEGGTEFDGSTTKKEHFFNCIFPYYLTSFYNFY